MRAALAQSRHPRCGGNVYLGRDRYSRYEQCFQFGYIRDILDSREVADMVSMPDKEIPKLKEPVMVRQPGVISTRVYLSKLVEPRACREEAK